MPVVEVWHMTRPTFTEELPEFPAGSILVATVHVHETDDQKALDLAYQATQHRTVDWRYATDTPTVILFAPRDRRIRSTSVGDVMRAPSGRVYQVMALGFRPLPDLSKEAAHGGVDG